MNDLLQTVINSAGGLKKWNTYDNLKADLQITGTLFAEKGHEHLVKNISFYAELQNPISGFRDFPLKDLHPSIIKNSITINNQQEDVLQSTNNFGNIFGKAAFNEPWTILQMAYFGSVSLWASMTFPFNLSQPGFDSEEISPLISGSEILRHLMVSFPDHIASPNKIMSFFFSKDGLLARADYEPEVLGYLPVTQIVSDYQEFQGIKFATKRKIYHRNEDGSYNQDKELIAIEVKSLALQTPG